MKRRELEKLLKTKSDNREIKDLSNEIISEVKGDNSEIYSAISEENTIKDYVKAERKRKTWFFTSLTAIVATATCFVLVMVYSLGGFSGFDKIAAKQKMISKAFSEEMFALGNVVSNVTEYTGLSFTSAKDDSVKLAESSQDKTSIEYGECQDVALEVNHYLFTAQALLSAEGMQSKGEKNRDGKYTDYEYKMTVCFEDARDYSKSYVAYCNIDGERNKNRIDGIILIDSKHYPLTGKSRAYGGIIETYLTITTGENDYVSVSHQIGSEANEYKYVFSKNGHVKVVSMEMLTSGKDKKMEIEIIQNDTISDYMFIYQKQTIECEYTKDGVLKEIMIFVHDDYYFYVFDKNYTIKMDKVAKYL